MEIFSTSSEFGVSSQKAIDALLNPINMKLIRNPARGPMSEAELLALPAHYEAIAAYSSQDIISARVMDHFPKLKVIARHGIGYDTIDIKAASARGIYVTNTHEGAFEDRAVSDLAMAMLLALSRNLVGLSASTKSGRWDRPLERDLYDRTLGIVGLGRIGKATAMKAKAFGMNVIAYDVFQDDRFAAEHQVNYVSLENLLTQSDFITLHCPLTEDNRGLFNAAAFAQMKPGAIFINCARGQLVDEAALYEAAKAGKLGGVGVDVYTKEPPVGNPLLTLPNVIATSHVGAYTTDTITAMDLLVVGACTDVLLGKCPNNLVNAMQLHGTAAANK